MARFQDWDFFNKQVQSGLTEGQFVNAGSVLLCAGPPFLTAEGGSTEDQIVTGDVVYPVGLINQWSIQQQMAVIPVPEAGSYRRYTITGPADGSFSMGRTLYHGPSLLRVMYAYMKALDPRGVPVFPLIDNDAANVQRYPKNRIYDAPGYENFYINLASDLFTQPVGILIYIQDSGRESYGAVYLEQLHIANHGMASGPGQLVVSEQVNCTFSRARPVQLANPVPLMARFQDSGVITTAGTLTNADGDALGTGSGGVRIPARTQSNR